LNPDFTIERTDTNAFIIKLKCRPNSKWEQWVLLRSDAHHDNPECDQSLERKHLEQAKERGAIIIDNGDLFCAMQGKYDPRGTKKDIRPEHQNGRYLDSLVETAADFYAPYAGHFALLGKGNHESSIKKRHETDLTERLAALLNARGGRMLVGDYQNWVRFRFDRGTQKVSKTLWMIHGYGGGGPVTKDTIQLNRQLAYVRDVDFILSGHTHDSWNVSAQTIGMTPTGKIQLQTVEAIKTPTYKEESLGGSGWHVEAGKPPKPLGAYWLRFYWNSKDDTVDSEVLRAK